MANFVVLNDSTLRQRLRQFGFRPDGPITDTTRDVYVRKLQRLERSRGTQPIALANATPAQVSMTPTFPFSFGQQASSHQDNVTPPSSTRTSTRTTLPAIGSTRRLPSSFDGLRQNELVARAGTSNNSDSNIIVHGEYACRWCAFI